jgi:RNA polymerase sigma-70 factor (ECF subfamily)
MIADGREPRPADRVEEDEQIERLLAGVDRLDESLRSVLVLRDFEQMDYKQVAEVLGVPVGTVKSRLFRARVSLRMELSPKATEQASERSDG